MRCYLVLVVMAMGMARPALAEETPICPHVPAILAAADLLLEEPAEKPRFWRDRYGADAAYLTIRYGGLDESAAEALLSTLEARSHPPLRINELSLAHDRTDRRMARLAELAPDALQGSILQEVGQSVLRALVVEGGVDWLIAELVRWRDADPEGFATSMVSLNTAFAVADLDDGIKADLAARAEAARSWQLALSVSMFRDDLSNFLAMLDRLPPDALTEYGETEAERRVGSIRRALAQAEMRPDFDPEAQPAAVREVDLARSSGAMIRPLVRLAAVYPDSAFLFTVVNQTGETAVGTDLAAALADRIEAGALDPRTNPDAVMVAIVEGLDRILGRARREGTLPAFDVAEAPGEQADAFVDRVLARAALAPFLRGDAVSLPGRPAALTADFDWERAARIAATLADGSAVADEDRPIGAGLLGGAGRFDEAVAMLGATSAWQEALAPAHALMTALDRRCDALLSPSVPMMEPIYRFPPR